MLAFLLLLLAAAAAAAAATCPTGGQGQLCLEPLHPGAHCLPCDARQSRGASAAVAPHLSTCRVLRQAGKVQSGTLPPLVDICALLLCCRLPRGARQHLPRPHSYHLALSAPEAYALPRREACRHLVLKHHPAGPSNPQTHLRTGPPQDRQTSGFLRAAGVARARGGRHQNTP